MTPPTHSPSTSTSHSALKKSRYCDFYFYSVSYEEELANRYIDTLIVLHQTLTSTISKCAALAKHYNKSR